MKYNKFNLACACFLIIVSTHAQAQYISTIAGTGTFGYGGDGGPAILAELYLPNQAAVDSIGNIYFTESDSRVRKINPAGVITTIAGNGIGISSGDGGPATDAGIESPSGIALDGMWNIYIGDGDANCIRKINPVGIITTIAGNGTMGYSGDGGPATDAAFHGPGYMTTDISGNVYVADVHNHCIRKINIAGIITTVAGTGTVAGYSGDGGPATVAKLNTPTDVAVDMIGDLYISDALNFRIRKVDTLGIITTFAGTGVMGYTGDGGPATAAEVSQGIGVSTDIAGNVYVCDHSQTIRKVNTAGIITTITGTGMEGFSGDGGPATAAMIFAPQNAAMYKNGDIYFSDRGNYRIRRISARPYFANGQAQGVTICNGTFNVDTLLAANDSNSGNTEYWSLVYGPFHGTASVAYTAVSTGGTVIPSGLTYTPNTGFTGIDTFMVMITDSVITDTTTVYVTVQLPGAPGIISGPDTVCETKSITLTDTTAGGSWGGSNAYAHVSGGSVLGMSPGIDTISYTVSNSCGAVSATYIVTVLACTNGVGMVAPNDAVNIYPNPGDGTFTLSVFSSVNEAVQVVVTDLAGEKVDEFPAFTNVPEVINIDGPAGVYFLGVVTKEGSYYVKVVINY